VESSESPVSEKDEVLSSEDGQAESRGVDMSWADLRSGRLRSGPWLRSMLFVPGHKTDWIMKAAQSGADALIIDLEDSVTTDNKIAARSLVADVLPLVAATKIPVFVRVNGWGTGYCLDDFLAVVGGAVTGIVLPKVDRPELVTAADLVLTELELSAQLSPGDIELLPLAETAQGLLAAYEICCASPRVRRFSAIAGLTPGGGGDLHRSLGVVASETGGEMAYADGQLVASARAAGVQHILGGLTVDVGNIALLERSLAQAKRAGATGSMAIHPSHVSVINSAFSPTPVELDRAVRLLDALRAAADRGDGAVQFEGAMVDYAHAQVSLELLRRAESVHMSVPEYPTLGL
jgi:citrate lyase subunit beta/citryl-CoA lyase